MLLWVAQARAEVHPESRRDRLRAETFSEIKNAALAQIAVEGASAVSIRGVARAIGMSPAGVYRYYDGLDALLTDLIADAYDGLATAVSTAATAQGTPHECLRRAMHAYRAWALSEPHRFLLILGTPIPGYEAPDDGPTEIANRRLGSAFFNVVGRAYAEQQGDLPPLSRPPIPSESTAARLAVDVPPQAVAGLLSAYAHLYGLVALEVLGQFHWVYRGADADMFFAGEVDSMIERLLP
jgi:AcrR family transcriptional regulator